jgi:hypothetical protein
LNETVLPDFVLNLIVVGFFTVFTVMNLTIFLDMGRILPPGCGTWATRAKLEPREAGASAKIGPVGGTDVSAMKLVEYGFQAASGKYHPDRGGDSGTMQKLNAAREYGRKRMKSAV